MGYKTIKDMITDNAYETPSNYMGPSFDGTFCLFGKNRDSDALVRSNYECILSELEKIGELEVDFEIESSSHWLCGWIEVVWVKQNASDKVLQFCLETLNALDSYPVFDESHFCELEYDELNECAESHKAYEADRFLNHVGIDAKTTSDELIKAAQLFAVFGFEASASNNGPSDAYFSGNSDYDIYKTIDFLFDNDLFSHELLSLFEAIGEVELIKGNKE